MSPLWRPRRLSAGGTLRKTLIAWPPAQPSPSRLKADVVSRPQVSENAKQDLKDGLALYNSETNLGLRNAWNIIQAEVGASAVTSKRLMTMERFSPTSLKRSGSLNSKMAFPLAVFSDHTEALKALFCG